MVQKKILIFSLAYEPFMGGAEIAIQEITNRLGGEFLFDLITLCLDGSSPIEEKIKNVHVYRVGRSKKKPTHEELVSFPLYFNKILYPFLAFFKAIRLHREKRYDFLWVMMAYAGFPAVFFSVFYPCVPYVLTLQEGDSVSYMTKRLRIRIVAPLLRAVFKRAKAVSAISNYLGQYARSAGFSGHVSIVPNGANVEKFKNQNPKVKINDFKQALGIRDTDKIIITTSRLVEKNAVGDIISALTYLPETVKLLIVGDGPLRKQLKLNAERLTLNARVLFLGHVVYEELPTYYGMADVFVRPSLSEGMGSSFIEAMAAGVPVVGTLVGGIVDFLKDRETGFVCEVKNPKSIAKQIEFIINPQNKGVVDRIVKNARQLVEEKYDWDKISQQMKVVFESI